MSANWGRNYRISIFGESHGKALGVNIDGIPAGTKLDLDFIKEEMQRRAPGKSEFSTPRMEKDEFEILSGYINELTTGTPLCMIVRNTDQRSRDYSELAQKMRPGHADYSGLMRYKGFNDIRGSGHFSGRITASIVFAGAVAKLILKEKGIHIGAHIKSIFDTEDRDFENKDRNPEVFESLRQEFLPFLNKEIRVPLENKIRAVKDEGDSVGGVVEISVIGMPAGVGDPFFNSVESELASMMYSIPAVKGLEFGAGFAIAGMLGSEANDEMYFDEDENIKTYTNNNGGIIGGITNGEPVNFKVAIKPPASISKKQKTVNIVTKENTVLEVTGRHDPVIVPRAVVVLECATAIVMLDCLLEAEKNKGL